VSVVVQIASVVNAPPSSKQMMEKNPLFAPAALRLMMMSLSLALLPTVRSLSIALTLWWAATKPLLLNPPMLCTVSAFSHPIGLPRHPFCPNGCLGSKN